MGKHNRQRRAAKARKRTAQRRVEHDDRWTAPPRPPDPPPAESRVPPSPDELFRSAVAACAAGDMREVRRSLEDLAAARRDHAAAVVAPALEREVDRAWARGWQPVDLDRLVGRRLGRSELALARWVIAAQAASYEALGARVAPAWMAQLKRIEATRDWDGRRPYLEQLSQDWFGALLAACLLMDLLRRLPQLPRLIDPPSTWLEGSVVADGSLPASVLAKVRALLAKAESTTFDAEAAAFTAKAQELMAGHRIDQALLAASGHAPGEEPIGRRIGIDDPYGDAKAMLLDGIARANGCRAVWAKDLGFSSVFGFADELDAVEELFTSLLLQATAALRREGSKWDQQGRSRTRRFRRSFLVAFARRVAQRLREAVDDVVEATSAVTGTALVPILAARVEATAAAVDAAFPDMTSFRPSASDDEGWFLGMLLGDQADLSIGTRLNRSA